MDLLEAHAHFCETDDRECVPMRVLVRTPYGLEDFWGVFATALADLSGRLEEAETEADLRDAAAHGWSLLNCGVVRKRDLREQMDRVVDAVLAWGDELEARRCSNG